MSLNVEVRERRLQKKRRKAAAFLAIAELNDLDKATAAKRRKLGKGVSRLGRGVNSLGRGVHRLGRGVNRLGRGVNRLGRGVNRLGRGVNRCSYMESRNFFSDVEFF